MKKICHVIRVIITQVLGDLQFNFYHRWFDVIFLVSAVSSIIFMYLAHQQKEIAERHAVYWKTQKTEIYFIFVVESPGLE